MTSKKRLILIGLLLSACLIAVTTVIAQQRRKPRPATPPSSPPPAQSKPQDKHSVGDKICIDVWGDEGEFCGIIEEITPERYKVQITTVYAGRCPIFLFPRNECEILGATSCSGDRRIRLRGYKQQGEAGVGDYVWIPKYCDGYGAKLKEQRRIEEERNRLEAERASRLEAERRRAEEETRRTEEAKLEAEKVRIADSFAASLKNSTNSIGIEFVLIVPGAGSSNNLIQKPAKPFYMGKHEITQKQWREVMGNNPAHFIGDDLPVDSVSFNEAKEFCKQLSQMTGHEYRLPTENEWEYAAGTTGATAGDLNAVAWHDGNSSGKTHPVGQKRPNAFGLFDMYGNVWEWCEDSRYSSSTCSTCKPDRVQCGGSWYVSSGSFNSTLCRGNRPDDHNFYSGFRVVVSARIQ